MVDVTQDSALMLECLQFVQEQSSGEWGEFIEQEDAKKLAAFVARHRSATRTLPKGSVEKVARALAANEGAAWDAKDFTQTPAGCDPEEMREGFREAAQAAIAAIGLKEE